MSQDYAYINARIKAWKSKLLKRETIYECIGAVDIKTLEGILVSTPYGKGIQEAKSHGKEGLRGLEEGFRRHLCDTTRKLLEITSGKPKTLLGVLISKWDLFNIKTVLRGMKNKTKSEEILNATVPAGNLDFTRISELAKCEDIQAVADTLSTWHSQWAFPIRKSLPQYQKDEKLENLEYVLDRFYVSSSLATILDGDNNAEFVRSLFKTEIDLLNLRTAMRVREENLPREKIKELFIGDGEKINEKIFVALCNAESFEEMLKIIPSSFKKRMASGDESRLESDFFVDAAIKFSKFYFGDPLMINVPLGFLWMKSIEVINLRVIARGITFGITREEIEREIIWQ